MVGRPFTPDVGSMGLYEIRIAFPYRGKICLNWHKEIHSWLRKQLRYDSQRLILRPSRVKFLESVMFGYKLSKELKGAISSLTDKNYRGLVKRLKRHISCVILNKFRYSTIFEDLEYRSKAIPAFIEAYNPSYAVIPANIDLRPIPPTTRTVPMRPYRPLEDQEKIQKDYADLRSSAKVTEAGVRPAGFVPDPTVRKRRPPAASVSLMAQLGDTRFAELAHRHVNAALALNTKGGIHPFTQKRIDSIRATIPGRKSSQEDISFLHRIYSIPKDTEPDDLAKVPDADLSTTGGIPD